MRHRVRPAAQADIDDSAEYLAADNIDAGVRFLMQVDRTINDIAETPGLGSRREFSNNRIAALRARRVNGFSKWLVFYLVNGDQVDVVRVLHGARDLDNLFTDEV